MADYLKDKLNRILSEIEDLDNHIKGLDQQKKQAEKDRQGLFENLQEVQQQMLDKAKEELDAHKMKQIQDLQARKEKL